MRIAIEWLEFFRREPKQYHDLYINDLINDLRFLEQKVLEQEDLIQSLREG